MEKSRKTLYLIIAVVVIAIGGYYLLGGKLNMSSSDAAGSGIDGVSPASKYSGAQFVAVDLDGAEVQQLLQNNDFQKLIQDKNFRELMKSPEFAALSKSAEYSSVTQQEGLNALAIDRPTRELVETKEFTEL